MARIAGVDLPGRKHVWIGLTRIFGIGKTKGREICEKARVELSKKIDELDEGEVRRIREVIEADA